MNAFKVPLITGILFIIAGCQKSPDNQTISLKSSFQKEYDKIFLKNQGSDSQSGFFMPTKDNLMILNKFIKKHSSSLHNIDTSGLTVNGVRLYKDLQKDLQETKDLSEGFQKNYSGYHLLPAIRAAVEDNQLTPELKARKIAVIFKNTPKYFQLAVQNLPKVSTSDYEKAIAYNSQTVIYLLKALPDYIQQWDLAPAKRQALLHQSAITIPVIKNYIAWCESKRIEFFKKNQKPLSEILNRIAIGNNLF